MSNTSFTPWFTGGLSKCEHCTLPTKPQYPTNYLLHCSFLLPSKTHSSTKSQEPCRSHSAVHPLRKTEMSNSTLYMQCKPSTYWHSCNQEEKDNATDSRQNDQVSREKCCETIYHQIYTISFLQAALSVKCLMFPQVNI